MGQSNLAVELGRGVKFAIYLREKQLEWLDAEVEKEQTTRSGYIQNHILPKELQVLQEGYLYRRNRGKKKC